MGQIGPPPRRFQISTFFTFNPWGSDDPHLTLEDDPKKVPKTRCRTGFPGWQNGANRSPTPPISDIDFFFTFDLGGQIEGDFCRTPA